LTELPYNLVIKIENKKTEAIDKTLNKKNVLA
jgi:hypothetical protein